MAVTRLNQLGFGTKICIAAALCTVASLVATGIAVGLQSSRQAEAAAQDSVRATARYAAKSVEAELSASLRAIQALAGELHVAKEGGAPPARTHLDATLKDLLEDNQPWLAAYSLWEPNALDGKDAEFVSKGPQNDATGRFVSYWNRGNGSILVEPLLDYEKAGANDWYDIPRRTGKTTLVEPYLYKVNGRDMLITSLVTPIMVNGRFAGIVGVDLLLSNMQQLLTGIESLPGSKVLLVSEGGKYISHPDPKLNGADAKDLTPEALQHVKQGKLFEYATADGKARVLMPIKVDMQTGPWSLCIEYDQAQAKAPAYAVMKLTAGIAVACAVLAVLAMFALISHLTRPLRSLASTMQSLAAGQSNLRVSLPVEGRDELAEIASSFNSFVAKLRAAFEDVQTTSRSIDGAAGEISAGNLDLSGRTEQQASSLEEISASMVQLAEGVRNSASIAQQADTLSQKAGNTAERSQSVMHEAVSVMDEVHASSKRIADITAVIDGIAFQTNILALNAAVEAARAGEQGRGFSVVAGEVRSLAQRAANAAKDIKVLINESVTRIENGTDRIRDSGRAVAELVAAVNETSHLVSTISQASGAQSQGIAQVESAINHLDGMTQQNAALVEQAAATAGALKQQTQRLSDTMGAFI
jgi:methyl-accepting chemotaxis protein